MLYQSMQVSEFADSEYPLIIAAFLDSERKQVGGLIGELMREPKPGDIPEFARAFLNYVRQGSVGRISLPLEVQKAINEASQRQK